MKLRMGRTVGRTLYHQLGPEPSDDDVLVGLVDDVELAALIVAAVNDRHVRVNGCDQPGCRCEYCTDGRCTKTADLARIKGRCSKPEGHPSDHFFPDSEGRPGGWTVTRIDGDP